MANGNGKTQEAGNSSRPGLREAQEFADWKQKLVGPVVAGIILATVAGIWTDWWSRRDAIRAFEFRLNALESDYDKFKGHGKRWSADEARNEWKIFYERQWLPVLERLRDLEREVRAHNKEAERYKQMIEELYKNRRGG